MKRNAWILIAGLLIPGCGASQTEPTAGKQTDAPAPTAAGVPQVSYEELLKTAEQQTQERNYNAAVQTCSRAIAASPNRPEAYLRRAHLFAEGNLLAQAIADMTSAIRLQPENPRYLNTRGYYLLRTRQFDRAEVDFNDAIGLDLNYPQPYNNRGLVAVSLGKYEAALKDFDNALRANPKYTDAYNNRGFALFQLNRLDESVASFTQALEVDRNYVNSISNRGRAYLKLNRMDDAIADFTRAIELQPDLQQHYILRAEAYRAAGREPLAATDNEMVDWLATLSELNQRIARNPRDREAWATRGRHLLLRDRFDEAEQSLKNALALDPQDPQALMGQALLSMHRKEYAKAVDVCTQALGREDRYEVHAIRGDAYFEQGDFDRAIADYEAARRFDERIVAAYHKRAEKYRTSGETAKADADERAAQALQARLTEVETPVERKAPRAMVIEQVSFEQVTPVQAEAPPVP